MDKDLKKAKSLVPLAYDGRLTDEEYRFIEDATRRYPELKLDLYRYERLGDIYGAAEDVRAPASIEQNVIAALQSEGAVKRTIRGLLAPVRRLPIEALGAAAAALVIVLAALAYIPSLTRTGKESIAHFDLEKSVPPTLSAPASEAPPAGTIEDRNALGGEDVALISEGKPEKKDKSITFGEEIGGSGVPETKLSCAAPAPTDSMTACVGMTEKASRVLLYTRSALPTTAKKEATPRSAVLIYTSGEKETAPDVLSIRDPDPANARREIVEKALALGGTVRTGEAEWRDEKGKTEEHELSAGGDVESETIDLPPEKLDEFFDYVTSRFPEAAGEVERLRPERDQTLLLIDIVPSAE